MKKLELSKGDLMVLRYLVSAQISAVNAREALDEDKKEYVLKHLRLLLARLHEPLTVINGSKGANDITVH